MAKKNTLSASRKTADALRREIMRQKDGYMLGSEDELIAKLNVSRPTFRQAAKLLEQEQMLSIRRGVGGGYFARHPSSDAVVHMAAVYLQARSANLADVVAASRPIIVEAARLVTIGKDAAADKLWKQFLDDENDRATKPFDFKAFLRAEVEFGEILMETCENPLLKLFLSVVYGFTASFNGDRIWGGNSDHLTNSIKMRNRIAEAIVAGDPEVTDLVATRYFEMIQNWLTEERRLNLEKLKMVR